MDTLKDKQTKSYTYLSRYASFPFYFDKLSNRYVYGITKQLGKNVPYVLHVLRDFDTLDSLALKYYGSPDYYWIIAYFNDIQDPFIKLKDKMESINIPSLSSIYWED